MMPDGPHHIGQLLAACNCYQKRFQSGQASGVSLEVVSHLSVVGSESADLWRFGRGSVIATLLCLLGSYY
jgi:hypothetical protein